MKAVPQALHAPSVCCVYLQRAELVPSCRVWLLPVSLKSEAVPTLEAVLSWTPVSFVCKPEWTSAPCPEEMEEMALISPLVMLCFSA